MEKEGNGSNWCRGNETERRVEKERLVMVEWESIDKVKS